MTNLEIFENTLIKCRNAVKCCVDELSNLNDVAVSVSRSLARVNELKLAMNTLRQHAAVADDPCKDLLASSEKTLSYCIEDYELNQSVFGEVKARAQVSFELAFTCLNALQSLCLNDQNRADVDALMAELSACQTALGDCQ